jgi:hypothetical protein
MAELIEMEKVAGRYQSKHDLMQDIPQSRNEKIDVKDHFGDGKKGRGGPKTSSSSNAKAKASSTTVNNKTENVYNQAQSDDVEIQTKAITQQSQTLNEQTGLMKAQSGKLDDLNITMDKLYALLYREHTKLSPKYQNTPQPMLQPDFSGMQPDQNGQTNSFADLAGSIMDMMGGGDGKGKGKKKPKIQKTGGGIKGKFGRAWGAMKNAGGSLLGLGAEAAEGGLGSRVMQGAKGIFSGGGGGGGWRGKLAKGAMAAGAAAVGYKGLESLGGLGAVSAHFESGKGGVGTISTGKGDHGGVSYGAHQLSSKSGTMNAFLRSESGSAYAQEFAGLQPGSAAFNQKYKEIVARDGEGFDKAQSNFIKATHYDPAARKLAKDTGLDVSGRSRAVQEMVYSTSTQYGGGSSVMAKALAGRDANSMSDEDIIDAVQNYKRDNVGTHFKSSSAKQQAGVAARAEREKAMLRQILDDERKNPQGVMKGEDKKGVDGNTAAEVVQGKTDPKSLPADSVAKAQQQSVGIMPMQPQDVKADEALGTSEDGEQFVTVQQSTGGVTAVDGAGMALAGAGIAKAGADGTKAATATKAMISSGEKATLKGAAKVGGKMLGPGVSVAMDGYRAAEVINDDKMSSAKKETELAGIGGSMAGAVAGGAIGATMGSVVPVAGTAVGGVIGSIGGAIVGEEGVKAGVNYVMGTPEEREAKAASKMYVNSPLLQGEHSTLPTAPVALPSVKDLMTVPPKAPTEIQTAALAAPAKPADATPVIPPAQKMDGKSVAETLAPSVAASSTPGWNPTPDEMATWKAMTVPVAPNAPSFHKAARDLAAKDKPAEVLTPSNPETQIGKAATYQAAAPKSETPAPVQAPAQAPTKTFDMPKQEAAPPSVTAPTYSEIKPFQQPAVVPNTPSIATNVSATPVSAGSDGLSSNVDRLATAAQSLADSAAKMAGAGGVKDGKGDPTKPGMPGAAPAGMQSVEAKPVGASLFEKLNPFSPASPQFYKSEPAISQRPQMAAPVVSAAPTPVAAMPARESAAPQPIDNISNIRMATQAPAPAPAAPAPSAGGGGGAAKGGGGGSGSDKPTLDEIPALISDFGLVFVNSGLL